MAALDSDVELSPNPQRINKEEDYKCVYTCTSCGHENTAVVRLRE
jgi:hypothetical protein